MSKESLWWINGGSRFAKLKIISGWVESERTIASKRVLDLISKTWLAINLEWSYTISWQVCDVLSLDINWVKKSCLRKNWEEVRKEDFIYDDIFSLQGNNWSLSYKAIIWGVESTMKI